MTAEQILTKIERPYEQQSDGSYIVALHDSEDFARVYTFLDKLEDRVLTVHIEDDKTVCECVYSNYELVLSGDLKTDEYTLTVEELKE